MLKTNIASKHIHSDFVNLISNLHDWSHLWLDLLSINAPPQEPQLKLMCKNHSTWLFCVLSALCICPTGEVCVHDSLLPWPHETNKQFWFSFREQNRRHSLGRTWIHRHTPTTFLWRGLCSVFSLIVHTEWHRSAYCITLHASTLFANFGLHAVHMFWFLYSMSIVRDK